jgi:hypothetical protein
VRELLELAEVPLLGLSALGDVAPDAEHADDLPVPVAQGCERCGLPSRPPGEVCGMLEVERLAGLEDPTEGPGLVLAPLVGGREDVGAPFADELLRGRLQPRGGGLVHELDPVVAVDDEDDVPHGLDERAVALLARTQRLLGLLAVVDVLDHVDEVLGCAVHVAHHGGHEVDPHERAVLADVALLRSIGVHLARLEPAQRVQVGVDRVGGRDVRERQRDQLVARVAEDVAQAVVDAHPPAVQGHLRHADGGLVEHRTEPRLALAQLVVDALPFRVVDRHGGDAEAPSLLDRPVFTPASVGHRNAPPPPDQKPRACDSTVAGGRATCSLYSPTGAGAVEPFRGSSRTPPRRGRRSAPTARRPTPARPRSRPASCRGSGSASRGTRKRGPAACRSWRARRCGR